MKIVIIGPAYPYRGGIADTNESFCAALNTMGHDASIITFTYQYPGFLFPGKTQFSTSDAPKDLDISRTINTINPLSWISTARTINRLDPDIVIVRYWLPFLAPCLGSIARRLHKKISLIAMCDNVIPHEKRMGDHKLTNYFLQSFDGMITLSHTTLEELNHFTDKPKRYFPHPINTNLGEATTRKDALEYLKLKEDKKYLLFFGLVRKYKGLDLTLQALALVKDPDIHLLVVGEFYDDPQEYLTLIDKLNIKDRVTIINEFVPTEDIKYYFSAADIVVQTYHTASQSGVTQIAYNFDRPILVTDVGGLSEMVPHQRVGYVSTKSPQDIAGHIADYFDHNRAAEFKKNIQEEKKKYTWQKFAEEVFELHDMIERSP